MRVISEEKPNMATFNTINPNTKRGLAMERINLIQLEWENQHIANARVKKHQVR